MIVVDSNILAARNLTSIRTPLAEQVQQKDPVWVVPVLWRYEFQNILATAIKAGQIASEHALEAWNRVYQIMSGNEADPSVVKVLELVNRYRITAYDGQFIALAIQMGIPCVTEDGELQKKFPGLALSMEDFLGSTSGMVRERPERYRAKKAHPVRGITRSY